MTRAGTAAQPDEVVLVDESGTPIGTAPRVSVHGPDTPRHLAFSCHLFAPDGRVLLTRRAVSKATWPGVWTNGCCGHPRPGEAPDAAVTRRVGEELGVGISSLQLRVADFSYRATDVSGTVENELCPVWVAQVDRDPRPDPDEVCDWTWVEWDDLLHVARTSPRLLSPWAVRQLGEHADALAPREAP